MNDLIAKLDKRLTGPRALDHVKLTKAEWAELRPMVEDGERYKFIRENYPECAVFITDEGDAFSASCFAGEPLDNQIDGLRARKV